MVNFSFCANKKIIFGWNQTGELVPILKNHSGNILLLTGKSVRKNPLWNELERELKREGVQILLEEISGEPSPELIDSLCHSYKTQLPSAVVALGGGSVLDAGKALSAILCEDGSITDYLEGIGTKEPSGNKLPFYALPTTAGTGSECTKNAVISRTGKSGFKKSLRHDNYIPDLALVDPRWLESLPPKVAASCGMDAFSQLLESYISKGASPITDSLAEEGLTGFLQSFRNVLEGSADKEDYSTIALGASLSGLTLANAGLGTVHGIAGILGGMVDIPHGTACGLLLFPVMSNTLNNLLALDEEHPALIKAAGLGQFLTGDMEMDTLGSIEVLLEELEEWTGLAEFPGLESLGFSEETLQNAARNSNNKNNPYSFTEEERMALLRDVF